MRKAFQGASYHIDDNPEFGAVFTYHLKDGLKTRRERRHEAEKEAGGDYAKLSYPSSDELRAEDEENDQPAETYILFNPEIVKGRGEHVGYEGCLSIPGYVGEVARQDFGGSYGYVMED